MADVARPALAEVLAALADSTRDRAPVDLDYVKRAIVPPRITIRDGKVYAPAESGMSGWYLRTDSTAEAVEALATVRLWPWEPGDERAPRWWCENCGGSGTCGESWKRSFVKRCSACRDASCGRCGGRGFTVEGDGSNAWDADAVLCTGCNGRSSLGHTGPRPGRQATVKPAPLPRLQRAAGPHARGLAGCARTRPRTAAGSLPSRLASVRTGHGPRDAVALTREVSAPPAQVSQGRVQVSERRRELHGRELARALGCARTGSNV